MNYNNIIFKVDEGIAIITFNRPKALNALNSELIGEFSHALDEIAGNEDIRVLILTGAGEKSFVAGADITELAKFNSLEGKIFARKGQSVISKLQELTIPVIAAVNGFALGGGCELAMSCDIRIVSTFAKFGQPEVNLGLIPGYAATQRLPRIVGISNALYLLCTADMITADEALRMGLVQKIVEPEKLMEEVMAMANRIASKGPKAVKKIKYVTRQSAYVDFKTGSELESKEFGSLFGNEGAEGMKAFLEKRKPNW